MAARAWLTPDGSIPSSQICLRIAVPDGLEWRAALRGAILSLAEEHNWEQFGSVTPEEAAMVFEQSFRTAEFGDCTMTERFLGEVTMKAEGNVPPGWLAANGQSVSRTTYSDLFDLIGTTYGADDGSTFRLPNFGLRFPTGPTGGNFVGSVGGSNTHTLTTSQMPSHAHTVGRSVGKVFGVPTGTVHAPLFDRQHHAPENYDTGAIGSGQPHNNIPSYVTMRFLIYAGVQAI